MIKYIPVELRASTEMKRLALETSLISINIVEVPYKPIKELSGEKLNEYTVI